MALMEAIVTREAQAPLGRPHARRLRDIHRSAGWPCHDALEVDLLASGMVARVIAASGHESLRVTDAGIALLAETLARNRAVLSAHEALVDQVAREMARAGRIVWRGLSLRARVADVDGQTRWCIAKPDVFSIRNTTVETYAQPVVHEVKVRRADLLGDLRRDAKRAAYLDLGGECWYVLGCDARGRCIGEPGEIPLECGVLVVEQGRLAVARPAPRRAVARIPFSVWMVLAKSAPALPPDDEQQLLGDEIQREIGPRSAPGNDSLLLNR